jgi:hypothetical protein
MEKMEGAPAAAPELPDELDEEILLDESMEEPASDVEDDTMATVSEEEIEGLDDLLLDEEELGEEEALLSEASEIEEDVGEETVLMEKMEGAPAAAPELPDELDEEIIADAGLEDLRAEEETGELEDMEMPEVPEEEELFQEKTAEVAAVPIPPVEGMVETEEGAAGGGMLPISEEKVEAIVTKAVTEVLERVTREAVLEATERIIKEEINALKKSILAEG